MNSSSILNADMASIGRWLREAMVGWGDELKAMCPPALASRLQRRWPTIAWTGAALVADGEDMPRRAEVHLPERLALVRRLSLPPMSRRDLTAAVALEAERLMPLPAGAMIIAIASDEDNAAAGPVEVAGIEREDLRTLCAALDEAGVTAAALLLQGRDRKFDFLPAARAAGLVSGSLSPAGGWWALVALLVFFNLSTAIWRDVDSVTQLQDTLAARQPISMAAQQAARRMQSGLMVARDQAGRRQRQDPVRALAEVTNALPDAAWVQRWSWDGRRVRISGYARGPLDVARVLRDSHRFADVRNVSSDVQGDIPAGHPFDVSLVLLGA